MVPFRRSYPNCGRLSHILYKHELASNNATFSPREVEWRSGSAWPRRLPRMCAMANCVAMEGFTHLIPFAAGHEIIRQGRRDLSLVRMTPDLIYDQLIGAGCAKQAHIFVGRKSWCRIAAPLSRRSGERLAAAPGY